MSMLATLLAALVGAQVSQNPTYQCHAKYPAGSPRQDTTAAGGHGTSTNLPKPAKAPPPRFAVQLTRADGSIRVRVVNGSTNEVWLQAADGTLLGWLEAEQSGVWVPLEYHSWYTCGNSYHRVLLPQNHEWLFEVPMPSGSWKTRVRWVWLADGRGRNVSTPISASIPATRCQYRGSHADEVTTEWVVPTLRPRPQRSGSPSFSLLRGVQAF